MRKCGKYLQEISHIQELSKAFLNKIKELVWLAKMLEKQFLRFAPDNSVLVFCAEGAFAWTASPIYTIS
jgi:hypothetical protein